MNTADVLRAAGEAGLVVSISGRSLQVSGPEEARAEFLPKLAAVAGEVAALIKSGKAPAVAAKCSGYHPTRACPACQVVHGRLVEDPCAQCGAEDWVTSVMGTDGQRLCSRCMRS